MDRVTYHEQTDMENILKLREVLRTLPEFSRDYFRAIDSTTTTKTRISYAYDIRIFFQFLVNENPLFKDKKITDLTIDVLDQVQALDIEEFMEYLKVYKDNQDTYVTNGETGLKRKISTLRSFYNYYFKHEMIKTNPPALITMPKLHEKAIVRLDTDEVAMLLDYIEHAGDQLSGQKKVYYEKTKTRDLALITHLLGTGIRVSECVGLDVEDLDFKNDAVKVTRKGGNEMFVYFGEEVEKALLDYLEVRETVTPVAGHEHALFYSIQRKRMGVQAVENLVKKYAQHITSTKKITPHKLRSTYGTALYRETGDIYLVADVLGHKDVNTTRKHYASVGDEQRRKAASALRLREEPPQKQ